MYNLKDFENFVSRYQQIETLAKRLKTDPAGILDIFMLLGAEVLNRSTDPLINEAKKNIKNFLDKYNICDFETLEKFIKTNEAGHDKN